MRRNRVSGQLGNGTDFLAAIAAKMHRMRFLYSAANREQCRLHALRQLGGLTWCQHHNPPFGGRPFRPDSNRDRAAPRRSRVAASKVCTAGPETACIAHTIRYCDPHDKHSATASERAGFLNPWVACSNGLWQCQQYDTASVVELITPAPSTRAGNTAAVRSRLLCTPHTVSPTGDGDGNGRRSSHTPRQGYE